MNHQRSPQRITVSTDSIRNLSSDGSPSWVTMDDRYESIFTIEIPLELADVEDGQPPALVFTPLGRETVQGVTPDTYTSNGLRISGELETSVDSLSRSIHAVDLAASEVLDVLQTQIDAPTFDVLEHELSTSEVAPPSDDTTAEQVSQLLQENIRRHEREHIRCLLDPLMSMWRELELYQRSIILASTPRRWRDWDFVDEFATLYAIPNCHMAEVLAMLAEDYTAADSTVQRVVESYVSSQNETQAEFLRFIDRHDIDPESLIDTLRSPVGELYCDFWLAYVIDRIRAGESLDEIDSEGFQTSCNLPMESIGVRSPDEQSRETLLNAFNDQWKGPVTEFVCLAFVDGSFVLRRSWISMNPSASEAECLLAIRRALFRREFLSTFVSESGLDAVRTTRAPLTERILWGEPLADVSLFRRSSPPPQFLSDHLGPAHTTARDRLFGSQATTDDLDAWLNDPDYG